MSTTTTFRDLIARRVGADTQGLEFEDFVEGAVRTYERYRPRVVVAEVEGNGTQVYDLSAEEPFDTLWEPGFSRITEPWGIEYPLDETPRAFLLPEDYEVRDLANTGASLETRVQALCLIGFTPSSTETFRVRFLARHTVGAELSTIPAADEHAVADFGAAEMFEGIAARYDSLVSQTGVSVQELVGYDTKATGARANARAARRRARVALGLPADERDEDAIVAPALAIVDFDPKPHDGYGYLTHRRRGL